MSEFQLFLFLFLSLSHTHTHTYPLILIPTQLCISPRQTTQYLLFVQSIDIHRVVFFDESGVNQRTANKRRGRGLRGRPAYTVDPHVYGTNYTVLASIGLGLPVIHWILRGGCTSATLVEYFVRIIPALVNAGIQYVIMDNCR